MEVAGRTPQQEVGERVRCPAWTDTMAYIIINYSWHLSLLRGREGVGDNARVHLRAVPWSPHGSYEEEEWVGMTWLGVFSVSSIQPKRQTGKEIPGIPLSLQLPSREGKLVTLLLITKLEGCRSALSAARP